MSMKPHRAARSGWMAAMAAIITLVVLPAMATEATTPPTDLEISMAVDDALIDDIATPAGFIDVSTAEGIVALDGSVTNILAKERAERIAESLRGVRGVVNTIEVLPAYRSDVEIREDVNSALLADKTTESWEIETTVDDAVVTLAGTVDSWQEKQQAGAVAKSVLGVKDLDNQLTIEYQDDRSDREVMHDIKRALLWDSRVDGALIDVEVSDGDVALSGTVGSAAERRMARYDAWVVGTRSVDSQELDVAWWARDDRLRRDKYVHRTDADIEDAVEDAFLYDPRVNLYDVAVDADAGRVTLRGTVENLSARRAAAADARNVVGVWDVDNNIKVRPTNPSDRKIARRLQDALAWDPYVERYAVNVSVINGHAYLYGDVDSTFEKARADDIAAHQVGVTEVHNHLTVNNGADVVYRWDPYLDDWYLYDYDWYSPTIATTTKTDWEIKEDIDDELFWSPFVGADEVTVTVDDGVATLTGTVDTWNERLAATENALEGGAISVDNDLKVAYGPDYYRP